MSLAPYLCIRGATAAIEFYKQALGARETSARVMDSEGRVGHSTIEIGGSSMHISDEHPEIGVISPDTLGGCPVGFTLSVADTDASYAKALAAGATSETAPEDQFYGARSATIKDPFGYRWFLQTQVETLTDSQMQDRVGDSYKIIPPTDSATS